MENPSKQLYLNEYLLKHTLTDAGLIMEAKHKVNQNTLSLYLTDEKLLRFSNHLISTCEVFEKILVDFKDNPSSQSTLEITSSDTLLYKTKFLIGPVEKSLCVEIPFEIKKENREKESNEISKKIKAIEALLQKQNEHITYIEKKNDIFFAQVDSRIKATEAKIDKILQKLDITFQEPTPREGSLKLHKFNPIGTFVQYFSFSSDYRKATSITTQNFSVFTESPLNRSANHTISIQLGGTCDDICIVGIADKTDIGDPDLFKRPNTIRFRYNGDVVVGESSKKIITNKEFEEGTVITFKYVSANNNVMIFYDKELVYRLVIDNQVEYYPFFFTSLHTGISGTIINYEL